MLAPAAHVLAASGKPLCRGRASSAGAGEGEGTAQTVDGGGGGGGGLDALYAQLWAPAIWGQNRVSAPGKE